MDGKSSFKILIKGKKGFPYIYATGKELRDAVVRCGMPDIYLNAYHTKARTKEICTKMNILDMIFEEQRQGHINYLHRIDNKYLDPSEAKLLSYYEGMFIATLLAEKVFGMEYMAHLSLLEQLGIVVQHNTLSPDFIGCKAGKTPRYGVFEAKGSIGKNINYSTVNHAVKQVNDVAHISGALPNSRAVFFTYSDNEIITSYIRESNMMCNSGKGIQLFEEMPYVCLKRQYDLMKENNPFYLENDVVLPDFSMMPKTDSVKCSSVELDNGEIMTVTMDENLYQAFDKELPRDEIVTYITRGNKTTSDLTRISYKKGSIGKNKSRIIYEQAEQTFLELQKAKIIHDNRQHTLSQILEGNRYWNNQQVKDNHPSIGKVIANNFDDLEKKHPEVKIRYRFVGRRNGYGMYEVNDEYLA